MQLIKTISSAFILFILYSCGDLWASNYDFETTAIYTAPKTKVTATVLTKGYVPKGHDLGDESQCLIISQLIFTDKPSDKIKVTSNGIKVSAIKINDNAFSFKDSTNYTSILIDIAKRLQIRNIDSTELVELGQVILSTGAGPKGTILKGQSKGIIVDTIKCITKDR